MRKMILLLLVTLTILALAGCSNNDPLEGEKSVRSYLEKHPEVVEEYLRLNPKVLEDYLAENPERIEDYILKYVDQYLQENMEQILNDYFETQDEIETQEEMQTEDELVE